MISDLNIYVNRDLCYACGICVDRCILDNLRLHLAPCRTACPLHMNCQGYVRLIAQGKEKEAAAEMRKYLPFGGILGRVCHHPCEGVCERTRAGDGAVHIRALKRYLADAFPEIAGSPPKIKENSGKTVAIVGSGPSGLMAAHDLRAYGHNVTVFEAASEPGGLLRWAIPSFRLPEREVKQAIDMLEQMGIGFETQKALGMQMELDDIADRFDAVLLAFGAGAPLKLGITGEDLEGIYQGLDLLKRSKQRDMPDLGRSVLVVGGGNCAVDVALTCRKLGIPEVRMICLEDRKDMPAFETELQEAQEEGVVIENCWGPQRFIPAKDGRIGVEVARCLSVFDDKGVFCPQLEDTCSLGFEADSIVIAIGQKLAADGVPVEYFGEGGLLAVDGLTFRSLANRNVFCSGDAVTGSKSVVEAMAQGREAAVSIDRFLYGEGLSWGRDFFADNGFLEHYEVDLSRAKGPARGELPRCPVKERTVDREVERVFTAQDARKEAERCLSCGRAAEVNQSCWFCLPCEIECPVDALEVKMPYLVR
ncbi:MAG: FAD-dependent oxidoreductase [Deltaproteobacteria bacterium]|nr:FAD-dependent oxidoreductase [Deltaproteobacteria bacterium]